MQRAGMVPAAQLRIDKSTAEGPIDHRILVFRTVFRLQSRCGVLAKALKGLGSRYDAPLPPTVIRPGLAPVSALLDDKKKILLSLMVSIMYATPATTFFKFPW
ncbi:hypothetical protein KTQ42_08275|uniref:hypothetical protein n=1 Tax=Noviherbaspirillum sp. L7-7A TaxID=2850560 RepID=UPI001C2BE15E|nr:hypothetical protein [Noviherbaspirillum sp. L7-7A]MBV0879297.1 hypothetical protein [Noviherbaspirillum sp. L7-7A]